MKVIKIEELKNTDREVEFQYGGFISYRVLTKSDEMGFTVCKTIIPKCKPQYWHYPNHLESCYCIKGYGELVNLETGESFDIQPDTIYVLNKNERHTFEAKSEEVVLISVFNPPLNGNETHKDGEVYE